ncbi:MAG: glycosyltransferase family 2 protein [Cyanobacteriota bacterium]|nr:glycosyltransferase family 2 protein [Cyanobacteriota bacterium]
MIYFLTVNYYSTELIAKLISSLSVNENVEYKTLIVNNSPDDYSIKELKSESVHVLHAGYNMGFGGACNYGMKWIYSQDSQAVVWLINPDAYLLNNSLEKVNRFFQLYPEVSILGTIIHTPKNEIWFAGGCFIPKTGTIKTQDLLTNTEAPYIICDWVSGCSLIVNLSNFRDCPQFDDNYFLYYEDFDFCRRYANQGYLIAVTKDFGVLHQPSSITNRHVSQKIKHSTYSYLLTLEKYTNDFIFIFRLLKLAIFALILVFIRPKIAFGKFYGLLMYGRQVTQKTKIKPLYQ